jgi:hypothetical protein
VLEDCDEPVLENGETTKPQPLVWNMLYVINFFDKERIVVICCISQYSFTFELWIFNSNWILSG